MATPSIASLVLVQWGARVEEIPTSPTEESDLLATLDGCRLLIEEKTKFDDLAALRERDATLNSGKIHMATTPIAPNNRLSGIVRKAVSQLQSSSREVDYDLRAIWFTGTGTLAKAKYHQFIATLYGSTSVYARDTPGLKTCYFFRNSEFYRHASTLDGAIVGFASGASVTVKLCLNPLSANWQQLRDSPFARHFTTGLIDPSAEEASAEAYIADTAADRNDQSAVLSYLQEKYGLGPIMNMDLGVTTATISVPANEP